MEPHTDAARIRTKFSVLVALVSMIWGISVLILGLLTFSVGTFVTTATGSSGGEINGMFIGVVALVGGVTHLTAAAGILTEQAWAFKVGAFAYGTVGLIEVMTLINSGGVMDIFSILKINVVVIAIIYCFKRGNYSIQDAINLERTRHR